LIKARISSTRHTVVRGPILIGLGNRPVLTPSHHDDLPMGINGSVGGMLLGLSSICVSRRKPVGGMFIVKLLIKLIVLLWTT
jgi:hypothetical protein